MNRAKFHVKKGDYVRVISGAHKAAEGKVLQILPAKQQVLVEGVRLIKKHVKKNNEHPQGAIIQREGPIHISNVKITEKSEKKAAKKTSKKEKADAPAAEAAPEKKKAPRKKKEEAAE
jgi:large subunit ribosomal protein L24